MILNDYQYDVRREIYEMLCIKDIVRFNTAVCKNELKDELSNLIQDTTLLNITVQIKLNNYPGQYNNDTRYLVLNKKQITIKTCKIILKLKPTKIEILKGKIFVTLFLNILCPNINSAIEIIDKILIDTNVKTANNDFLNILLCFVANQNCNKIAEKLLQIEFNPNIIFRIETSSNDGSSYETSYESPLYTAVRNNNVSLCEMLIKNKADPNFNIKYDTKFINNNLYCVPLCRAITTNNILVNLLLKNGANPNVLTNDFENNNNEIPDIYEHYNSVINPIDIAIGHHNFAAVSLLVNAGANMHSTKNYIKPNNIFNFCINYDIDSVDVNYSVDDIRYLINLGANINCINDDKNALNNILCITRYIYKYFETMIGAGIDINRINKHGNNILFELSKYSDSNYEVLQVVKLLINNGININLINNNGKTALWNAIENNNFYTTQLLIKSGANLLIKYDGKTLIEHMPNINNNTPFYKNSFNKNFQLISKLLKKYDNDTTNSHHKCVICCINDTNMLYMECLHLATCFMCSEKMDEYICPVCKISSEKCAQIRNV